MLPDFLCVGAAKAGSTTIHDILSQHPAIYMPPAKEIHFFDNDANFVRGTDWYADCFSDATPAQKVGEVTPAYMSYDVVPRRICDTLGPDVKLLFTLREPVARAYSEYLHNQRRGFIDGEFGKVSHWEFERSDLTRWDRRKFSFISRGFYVRQISEFLKVFPRENMLFLVMEEDFGQNLPTTIADIVDFIGVEAYTFEISAPSNVAYEPRSELVQKMLFTKSAIRDEFRKLVWSDRLRRAIRQGVMRLNGRGQPPAGLPASDIRAMQDQYYRDELENLGKLIDRELAVWRDDSKATQND